MHRLDPAHPPLWRSATTLQFGVDAVAVIRDPQPWQLRLVAELEHGVHEVALDPVALALGAPERAAESFVRLLGPALIPAPSPRLRVALQTDDGFPRARATAVAESLEAEGVDVTHITWFGAPEERVRSDGTVVVLAHHVVQPRRAAALMAADVPHVPLVLTGTGAEVGPFIDPGRTPCLACLAAHRRDADPAWPQLAAQLLGRPAPVLGDVLIIEAAFVTARLISEALATRERPRCHSLTLREGSLHRAMRAHRPHADCRCRSLGGTETAGALAFPSTMTSSDLARPA
jgi:hypothetical protein